VPVIPIKLNNETLIGEEDVRVPAAYRYVALKYSTTRSQRLGEGRLRLAYSITKHYPDLSAPFAFAGTIARGTNAGSLCPERFMAIGACFQDTTGSMLTPQRAIVMRRVLYLALRDAHHLAAAPTPALNTLTE